MRKRDVFVLTVSAVIAILLAAVYGLVLLRSNLSEEQSLVLACTQVVSLPFIVPGWINLLLFPAFSILGIAYFLKGKDSFNNKTPKSPALPGREELEKMIAGYEEMNEEEKEAARIEFTNSWLDNLAPKLEEHKLAFNEHHFRGCIAATFSAFIGYGLYFMIYDAILFPLGASPRGPLSSLATSAMVISAGYLIIGLSAGILMAFFGTKEAYQEKVDIFKKIGVIKTLPLILGLSLVHVVNSFGKKGSISLCLLLVTFSAFSQIDTTKMSPADKAYVKEVELLYGSMPEGMDNASVNFSRRYHPDVFTTKSTENYLRSNLVVAAINDSVCIGYKGNSTIYYDKETGYYLGSINSKEKMVDFMGLFGGENWFVFAEPKVDPKKISEVLRAIKIRKFDHVIADSFYQYITKLKMK